MKILTPSIIEQLSGAAFAVAVIAMTSSVSAQNWTGANATSGTWAPTSGNWDSAPAFNNTTDLTFNDLTRATENEIGFNRTVRSITFGDNIDGTWTTNMTTGAVLTFAASSGNASLTVNSGSTANITFNGGTGVTGSQSLTSNLDIIHNGSGLLTFNRQTAGAGGITKTGNGTAVFTGGNANTFTGPLSINAGRLVLSGTTNATQDLATAVNINLGGGTLEMRTDGAFGKTLTQNITVSAVSTLAYNNTTNTTRNLALNTGSMVLNANLTMQNISSNTTLVNAMVINRSITGDGDLVVRSYNNLTNSTVDYSLGRLALTGNNSGWSGDLVIAEGTANVSGNSTLGSGVQTNVGTGTIILGETANAFGAGLQLAAAAGGGAQLINNHIIVRSGGYRTIRAGSDHTYTLNGTITLDGNLNVHNGLFFTDKDINLNGNISGAGGLNISRSGNGRFVNLNGDNSYTGATVISADTTLRVSGGNAIGNSSAVSLEGVGSSLTLLANETVGSLASTGAFGSVALGNNTLTVGGNNGNTSYNGAVTGAGGNLIKDGSGTFTLGGTSNYGGNTTVSAGGLLIAGAVTSPNTIVASLARIGGDGTLTGNLSLSSGARLVFSMSQTLDVIGTVTLDNSFGVGSLVNADGSDIVWSAVDTGIYTLIETVSTFDNITNFGAANAFDIGDGRSAYFQNGSLQLVVIPEASTWAIMAFGLSAMIVLRRRQTKKSGQGTYAKSRLE